MSNPDSEPPRRRRWVRWTSVAAIAVAALVATAANFLLSPRSDTDFIGVIDSLCDELRIDRLSQVAGIALSPSTDIPPDSLHCTLEGPVSGGEAWIRFGMATGHNVDWSSAYSWNADTSLIEGVGWKFAGQWQGLSSAKIFSLFGSTSAAVTINSSQSNFGDAALAVALLNEWLV